MKTRLLSLITLVCAVAASLQVVHASTITVTSTADPTEVGKTTLRDALAAAASGDTINFSVTTPATITLTSGQLVVSSSVTISGPGADQLSVNGNFASRVFDVTGSSTVVTISALTITNGFASGANGGGIYNDQATLTVSDCTVSGNASLSARSGGGFGGAIYNNHAMLSIVNSSLSGNEAISGGGIYNDGSGGNATLTISNSTLSGNSGVGGGGGGGGIFNNHATLTVSNSTLSGNSTSFGGGIYNDGSLSASGSATLTISNSTLSGNSAVFASGIFNDGFNNGTGSATLTISNSTLSGTLTTNGSLIEDNGTYSATVIGSTVLNAASNGDIVGAGVTSLGYNLSSNAAGGDGTTGPGGLLNATGDMRNTDPMLGPLANNGGPTFTHALLAGSPAINAGDPSFTPPPDFDQRGTGFPRVVGGRIDIGSFEVQNIVCPQPQGYWKNNPNAWPVSSLTLGSQTYTKTQLLTILGMPIGTGPKADASLILADQLIAAKLNIANGADGTPVASTITDADNLLSAFNGTLPYHVKPSTTTGHAMVNDAATLNSYNNGLLTAGCGG